MIYMINEREGSLLRQMGLTCVAHLFEEDDLSGALRHGNALTLDRVDLEGHLSFKMQRINPQKTAPWGQTCGGLCTVLKR